MAIYLDYNAATPVDPRAVEAMRPYFSARFGNPASRDHAFGWDAADAIEDARHRLADLVNVRTAHVTFVSGATEALNMLLRAYVGYDGWATKKIVTCRTEHEAVLAPARYLSEKTGVGLAILSVDRLGHLSLGRLRAEIEGHRRPLVILMSANNEIGTLHPVQSIASLVHRVGGVFTCDTTQSIGKQAVDLNSDGMDFAVMSAHKMYGPKGAGALITCESRALRDEPLISGGGQEAGRHGGTHNVPAIVGLGAACTIAEEACEQEANRIGCLRDRLEQGIRSQVADTWINGDPSQRLCNTTSLGFKAIDARTLIRDMPDLAVSTRAACSSSHEGPSHVLKAIGLSDEDAYSCIRFSLGRFTTDEEIDYGIEKVVTSVHKLRRLKSLRT